MSRSIQIYIEAMMDDDKLFLEQLGKRIAKLRKEAQLTQVQMANLLNISQQHMASFEAGRRKIPVSILPKLAQIFAISVDELLGFKQVANKRGPTPKLQQQMEQIGLLPNTKRRFVMEMLDTVLQQSGS